MLTHNLGPSESKKHRDLRSDLIAHIQWNLGIFRALMDRDPRPRLRNHEAFVNLILKILSRLNCLLQNYPKLTSILVKIAHRFLRLRVPGPREGSSQKISKPLRTTRIDWKMNKSLCSWCSWNWASSQQNQVKIAAFCWLKYKKHPRHWKTTKRIEKPVPECVLQK
jgi:hypothetical protein